MLDVSGRTAIHAYRNDFRHSGGDGECVGQWLAGAGCLPVDRVGQPRGHAELVDQRDDCLGLVDVGDGLDRQHVGFRIHEHLEARPMPVDELRDGEPVAPDVLLAIGQCRAVRPDGRGHPPSPGERGPPQLSRRGVPPRRRPRRGRPWPARRCAAAAERRRLVRFRVQRSRRRTPDSSRWWPTPRRRGRTPHVQPRFQAAHRRAAGPTTGRRTSRGRGPPARSPNHRR